MSKTKSYRITQSQDDVHSVVGGAWSDANATITLGRTAGNTFEAYFRWNIDVPKYSTVTNAYVRFQSDTTLSTSPSIRIHLLDFNNADSVTWTSDPRPLGFTPITQDWLPGTWTATEYHETININYLVQSFIDRSGYAQGNYIGIAFTTLDGSGGLNRIVRSFETNAENSPRLVTTYNAGTSSVLNSADGRSTRIEIDVASTVNVTHWQIFEEGQPIGAVSSSTIPYPVKISSNHTKPSNVTSMDTSHISVWFPPDKKLKVRYRFDKDKAWSEFIHFTAMGYLTSYDRGRMLSGLI